MCNGPRFGERKSIRRYATQKFHACNLKSSPEKNRTWPLRFAERGRREKNEEFNLRRRCAGDTIESVEFTRCAPCTRAVHEKLGKRKSSGRWKEKWRWRTGVVPCSVLGVLKCVVLVISRKMILFWRDILSWLWKNVFVQRDSWLQRI